MIQIVCGVVLIVLGTLNIYAGIYHKLDLKSYVNKVDVVEAMSGDWNTFTFITNTDHIMTDKQGNSKFYSVKDIDERVKKLNQLLKETQ